MGSEPGNAAALTSPVSEIKDQIVTPAPYVKAKGQVFFDEMEITLACADRDAVIFYTTDGSAPSRESKAYKQPFTITKNAIIRATASSTDAENSPAIRAEFFKVDQRRTVIYNPKPDPQYFGGGEKGLIDYIRGGDDFRTGMWQGWQGTDVEVIVDLHEPKMIKRISSGYIQDIRSWIFMPKAVKYYTSQNGKDFIYAGQALNTVPDDQYGAITKEFTVNLKGHKARYVKVVAEYYGIMPDWHLGAGSHAWLFMDEVVIN